MAVQYLSLDITCTFITRAVLPVFKGSTLRGAFGHSLKKVTCALRNQACETCLLADSCVYALIFATEKLTGGHVAARPHPYILNPPATGKIEYKEGDSLDFNLVFIGQATDFLPHIVYTVEAMGQSGIGQGNKAGAGRFLLSSIRAGKDLIYSECDKLLHRPDVLPQLELEMNPDYQSTRMTIDLLSPLRIKSANELQRKISFSVLVRAALRRVSALEKYYGNGEPDLDFRGLCQQADIITTIKDDSGWRDYKRYSNKQKRNMLLGGVMGRLQFEGELQPFVPLFNYSRMVNLGKQTAFGLGRIDVKISK